MMQSCDEYFEPSFPFDWFLYCQEDICFFKISDGKLFLMSLTLMFAIVNLFMFEKNIYICHITGHSYYISMEKCP